jgi:hypothetical protein
MNCALKLKGIAILGMAWAVGGTAACSDDPKPPTDASTSLADSGPPTVDAGSADTAPAAAPLSLYGRLGGKAGLESFVKTVVETRILTDADLKTFFFNQVATPIPAGHPSATQIVVCFARLVGAALKADTYPGPAVADPGNTNTPIFTCRDMVAAHKGPGTMLNTVVVTSTSSLATLPRR